MRALNELVIRGPRTDLLALLQQLEASLSNGWRRDRVQHRHVHQRRQPNVAGGVMGARLQRVGAVRVCCRVPQEVGCGVRARA